MLHKVWGYDNFMTADLPPLADLETSWLRQLRAERKSPRTLEVYRTALRAYARFLAERGLPAELSAPNVMEFIADHPGETSTIRLHLTCLKLLARWLADEEGFDAAAITALRLPRADVKAVPILTDAQITRLVAACAGNSRNDRRDRALVLLAIETGLRAAELVAVDVTDVDLDACVVLVRRGKGGKARRVRFSPATAAALDRWLRARRLAVHNPASGPLWINRSGDRFCYVPMRTALKARAAAAGIEDFHMHRLRHTAATRWLRAGGSEVGLMHQAGWSSRTMISRYTAASSEQIASEEFDRLGLQATEL
jgi:site-specific recombinase XerD